MRPLLFLTIFLLSYQSVFSQYKFKGTVFDANSEPLIGATVQLEPGSYSAIVGLDGSFNIKSIPSDTYKLIISYVGYKSLQENIEIKNSLDKDFLLEADNQILGEVLVRGNAVKGSEVQARLIERKSPNTMSIISAKSIALSPDVTVANVIQRVSGLSVERNANGDAQHAIIRGMDKRYNYTLVNGVKIPSPSNTNRYVPLDIFPAQMLERLEVNKSLTADMEGDAVGGAMNLVMKDAPEEFEVNADFQLGYNQINLDRGFLNYDQSAVNRLSPQQIHGEDYSATQDDFSSENLSYDIIKPKPPLLLMPDILSSLTIGDRFFDKKLGVMFGGSFQNTYRGVESIWYDAGVDLFGSGRPILGKLQERSGSTQQQRAATHTKLDYRINKSNNISFYGGGYFLNDFEVRESLDTEVDGRNYDPEAGTAILSHKTRYRSTYQKIWNATLQGEHNFGEKVSIDWSTVYSLATNDRPDNTIFIRNGELINNQQQPQSIERRNPRRWENNSDQDISTYLNAKYYHGLFSNDDFIGIGGLYRMRDRDSYFNRYIFDPFDPARQVQGRDWDTYADVNWDLLNPRGSTSDPLNFLSGENILAYYIQTHHEVGKLEVNAGLRMEETEQFYTIKNALSNVNPDSSQTYRDLLPSIGLKYRLLDNVNIRSSYFKALSRPGFHEIVPYRRSEEDGFTEAGNPSLDRVIAHNFDLRFEYYPSSTEQILAGFFYKKIDNPIELTLRRSESLTQGERRLMPGNFGTAINYGAEFDFIKYFNKIGIRANYTFTNSSITTTKVIQGREDPDDTSSQLVFNERDETRPLQGQANHIGNLSLLWKDQNTGTDAQLSLVYTGERLEFVSPFYNNDHWSKPITILDLSIEQKIKDNWVIFIKANNLLNTPYQRYIKQSQNASDIQYPYQEGDEETLVRREFYQQSYRLGIRIKF